MKNTLIEYMYRDASNYKVWNQCVVQGELNEEQKQSILDSLSEGEYFIPSQVGLPEVKFDEYDGEDDHPWFEMWPHSFSETSLEPTVHITTNQLVAAFQAAKGNWEPDYSEPQVKKALDFMIREAADRIAGGTDLHKPLSADKAERLAER